MKRVDLSDTHDFEPLAGMCDTVVCLNVLDHIPGQEVALKNIRMALEPGGKTIILVPQNPFLHRTLDEVLGHQRRYTRASLQEALTKAGFTVGTMFA